MFKVGDHVKLIAEDLEEYEAIFTYGDIYELVEITKEQDLFSEEPKDYYVIDIFGKSTSRREYLFEEYELEKYRRMKVWIE